MTSYILCKILSLETRVAQKGSNTSGSYSLAELIVLWAFNIQKWFICSSIRNWIAYASEANIVNKDSPIQFTFVCFGGSVALWLGRWICNPKVSGPNPPLCHWMDLSLMVPDSTLPRFVNSQLVSLPSVKHTYIMRVLAQHSRTPHLKIRSSVALALCAFACAQNPHYICVCNKNSSCRKSTFDN